MEEESRTVEIRTLDTYTEELPLTQEQLLIRAVIGYAIHDYLRPDGVVYSDSFFGREEVIRPSGARATRIARVSHYETARTFIEEGTIVAFCDFLPIDGERLRKAVMKMKREGWSEEVEKALNLIYRGQPKKSPDRFEPKQTGDTRLLDNMSKLWYDIIIMKGDEKMTDQMERAKKDLLILIGEWLIKNKGCAPKDIREEELDKIEKIIEFLKREV